MSLMEKFFILFQTDAGELTKELDKAETSAQDLAKEIDKVGKVDTDKVKELPPTVNKAKEEAAKLNRELTKGEAQAKRMGQSFLNVAKGLAAPVLAFASITGAVAGAVARAGEIEGLAKVADQSRIAVGDLDALGRAARNLGGDVSTAQNDIKTLSDNALEAVTNRSSDAAQSFKGLGLTLKNQNGELKNTNDILLDLADATAKMSNVKATDKLKKLGITDPGMIKLILAGKKAVLEHVEAQKEASEITEQQVEAARKYKAAQNEFSDATTGVANELVGLLLPSITSIVKGLTVFVSWCKNHKNVVIGFFAGVALVVTSMYLPAMIAAAAATLAATWPIILAIGVLAGLALVFEDIMAYLNGQPSLIGDLAAKWEWFAQALEWVKERAEPVIAFLKAIWGGIVAAWNGDFEGFFAHFFEAWEAVKIFLSNVAKDWGSIFNFLADAWIAVFKTAFDGIKKAWADMWGSFTAIVDPIIKNIKDKLLNMLPQWVRDRLGWGGDEETSNEVSKETTPNIQPSGEILSSTYDESAKREDYGDALEYKPQPKVDNAANDNAPLQPIIEDASANDNNVAQPITKVESTNDNAPIQPRNEPLGALEFQPIIKVEQPSIIVQPPKDGVQRVDNDVVPGLNPVAPSTVQPAQNQIKATAATPIPANPVQKQEVKKDVNVSVAAPNITINNTMDTEAAANTAASKVSGMLNREINKAIANSADGIAR